MLRNKSKAIKYFFITQWDLLCVIQNIGGTSCCMLLWYIRHKYILYFKWRAIHPLKLKSVAPRFCQDFAYIVCWKTNADLNCILQFINRFFKKVRSVLGQISSHHCPFLIAINFLNNCLGTFVYRFFFHLYTATLSTCSISYTNLRTLLACDSPVWYDLAFL